MCLLVIEIILFNIVMPPIRLTVRVYWFGFVFQVSEIASFIFGFASRFVTYCTIPQSKLKGASLTTWLVCSLSFRLLCPGPGLSSVAFV